MKGKNTLSSLFKKNGLEILISSLPLVGVLFSVVGILKAIAYYHFFGINILEYIGFGEVITLFFTDILDLVVTLVFFVIFEYAVYLTIPLLPGKGDTDNYWDDPEDYRHLIIIWRWVQYIIIAIVVSTVFVKGYLLAGTWPALTHNETVYETLATIQFLGTYIAGHIAIILEDVKQKPPVLTVSRYLIRITLFNLVLYVVMILYTGHKEGFLKREYPEKSSQVELTMDNGKTVRSNNDTLYIGRTNQFVFLFLKKENKSMVINSDKISITLLNKKDSTGRSILY